MDSLGLQKTKEDNREGRSQPVYGVGQNPATETAAVRLGISTPLAFNYSGKDSAPGCLQFSTSTNHFWAGFSKLMKNVVPSKPTPTPLAAKREDEMQHYKTPYITWPYQRFKLHYAF